MRAAGRHSLSSVVAQFVYGEECLTKALVVSLLVVSLLVASLLMASLLVASLLVASTTLYIV